MFRVFLLSPARLSGVRGRRLLDGAGPPELAAGLENGGRVPLGEVFASISSLYYRGKRQYARTFGRRSSGGTAVFSITSCLGVVPESRPVCLDDLRVLAGEEIDPDSPDYLDPLMATAESLDQELDGTGEIVLLGSVATGKYVEPLSAIFGRRLLFPRSFIGRGDMSRGSLLLRAAGAGEELRYVVAVESGRRRARAP